MYLYHVKAEYGYRQYNFIISAKDEDHAKSMIVEVMNNKSFLSVEYSYTIIFICETENDEVFYEM